MQLICVNDDYSLEHLMFFTKYGLKYPKKGEQVEFIRKVIYSFGAIGLIVSPYDKQYAPTNLHGVQSQTELSFSIDRFRNLDNSEITKEQLKSVKIKEQV
jgi:hypothetical protein